jgi:iron complex transport system permease protein
VKLTSSLTAACAAALLLALFLGATPLSPLRALPALFGVGVEGDVIVIQEIRLPRALAAFAVGSALGLSGAAMQGLFRNPLAEPGVLGVSATAALAASLCIYWGLASVAPLAVPICAIGGALAATGILSLAAHRTRSVVTLILIGVGLSSFAGALMSLLMNLAPHPFTLSDMIRWMLGSVANRSLDDLLLATPFMALGAGILWTSRHNLSALTLGEEAAAGVGVDLKRARLLAILGAGLCAGASVALAGAIGFVGIVAPHVVRPFVGYDPARTLLPAALAGGLVLTLADILVRLLPTATELQLGVVAALLGAPAFVWIAAKRGGFGE